MTPFEASSVIFEEPDWRAVFDEECACWPKLPRYLAEDAAFPEVLKRWRRFHHTGAEPGERMPAPATEGVIALARLGVMPPRSIWRDIPHGTTPDGYQSDDHMWLSIAGEQWRIVTVESRMLCLEKMTFDGSIETRQVDLNKAKWEKHAEAALAAMKARREYEDRDNQAGDQD